MVRQLYQQTEFPSADTVIAYGDMNLFCSCAPVDSIDGMTGAAAPAPT